VMSLNTEQVRKRGLPPLVQSKQRRGQAPLPDLFAAPALRKVSQTSEEKPALINSDLEFCEIFRRAQSLHLAIKEA
jgi:hypothetical protein